MRLYQRWKRREWISNIPQTFGNLILNLKEPKKLKPVPADTAQRTQYYADLRSDDTVLLKDVSARLGTWALSTTAGNLK
jgi:hypothetical protein